MSIDLSFCRAQFPALRLSVLDKPAVFFDGPGGTQVPQSVVDAVAGYLAFENSNTHGAFLTSRKTDARLDEARVAMADFLGAEPAEIAFGANMTTLNYILSRALARNLKKGDRVIVTQLDHEANRGPWMALEETGAEVVQCKVDLDTCTLDMADMRQKITPNTRIVAVGYASNAVGTINDVTTICRWAREVGATSIVDAVHYAAHGPIDVREIGCDYLVCSAYKFFGPHVGVMYGRKGPFTDLVPYKLLPQSPDVPEKIETGTLNHEGIAGVTPAVDFIASIGQRYPELAEEWCGCAPMSPRRRHIIAGMRAISAYEERLARRVWNVLNATPGVTVYGLDPDHPRTPTFSFSVEGATARQVAEFLGDRGIFVWAGDFFATTLVRMLCGSGKVVRIGLAPYNTDEEVCRLEAALNEFVERPR